MMKILFHILALILLYVGLVTSYSCFEQCEYQVCLLPSEFTNIKEQECVNDLNDSLDCVKLHCNGSFLKCILDKCSKKIHQQQFYYCCVACQEKTACDKQPEMNELDTPRSKNEINKQSSFSSNNFSRHHLPKQSQQKRNIEGITQNTKISNHKKK